MSADNELNEHIRNLHTQLAQETNEDKKNEIRSQIADLKEFIREIRYEHRM